MNSFLDQLSSLKVARNPSISNESLFKFQGAEISFDDANKNVAVFGGTSSGKTNMARNGLERLIEKDCPGIVLDVKGDYKEFLLDLAPERVVVIGATEDCSPINLIGGMTCEKFMSFISDEIDHMHKEKFWGTGGLRDTEFLFRFLQEDSYPTLASLYDRLLDPEKFSPEIFKKITLLEELDENLINSFSAVKQAAFSFYNRGMNAEEENIKLFEQYEWHTASILSVLRNFSTNALIRDKLSAKDKVDIGSLIYEENKIVVLDMPVTRFGSVAYTISRLIRQQFVDAMFSLSSWSLAKKGLGFSKYTFMLIDEYQQFINISQGKNTCGLYDDNLILDKTRQYGHINILATQGVSSLQSQATREGVESLLQNCRTQVFFSSNDQATLSQVNSLSQSDEITESVLKPVSKGMAYLYTAHASSKQGGSLSGVYRCPRNKWTPIFGIDGNNPFVPGKIKNPFFVNKTKPENKFPFKRKLTAPILLVSTSEMAENEFFKKYDEKKVGLLGMTQVLRLRSNHAPEAITRWLNCFDLKQGDAVCFIRELKSAVPSSLFDDDRLVNWAKVATKNGVTVLTGIYHDGALSKVSTKACVMPSEVAFAINEMKEEYPF